MAFKPLSRFGNPVQLAKANEEAVVQVVELSNDDGRPSQFRLEVRKFWNGRPSKDAIALTDPDAALDLADAIVAAVESGLLPDTQAPAAAVVASVPVVDVKRRTRRQVA